MRKKLTMIAAGLAAAFASIGGFGLAAQEAAPAAKSPAQTATPPMWRVADADSEFILLGTFHILPPSLKWRTESVERALATAETVYFEIDGAAPETQAVATRVTMLEGFNTNGAMLTGVLDAADAQKLRDITADLGLPIAGVDPMRPWYAFLTLSVQFIIDQGFAPGAGLDTVLLGESRALGKQLAFFETIEEQLALFTELPPETEMALLVLTLRDWDNQTAGFAMLFDAWRNGDVDAIDVMMNDAMRDQAPEVYTRLIVDRNKAWVETLAKAIDEGSGTALVAVGAGHLTSGADSVPAMLAAKGYEVSRYGNPGSYNAPANDNRPDDQESAELSTMDELLQSIADK